MRTYWRKILAVILSIGILVTAMPATAFADETAGEIAEEENGSVASLPDILPSEDEDTEIFAAGSGYEEENGEAGEESVPDELTEAGDEEAETEETPAEETEEEAETEEAAENADEAEETAGEAEEENDPVEATEEEADEPYLLYLVVADPDMSRGDSQTIYAGIGNLPEEDAAVLVLQNESTGKELTVTAVRYDNGPAVFSFTPQTGCWYLRKLLLGETEIALAET
ncbi:MAG: hypothetical protein IJL72_07030, partial [Lachnospiraceae bacterium]|nr:hypothetical protein [Lachnospiraceae bacterium]